MQFTSIMAEYVVKASSFNPAGRFLIMFANPDVRYNQTRPEGLAEEFFRLMFDQHNAAQVVFCYASGIQSYQIYITDPYRNVRNCGMICANATDFM